MKKYLLTIVCICLMVGEICAQELPIKSGVDIIKVSSGDKIELKVGESLEVYSDTKDIVDRYDKQFEGAYLNAAYVYFSDGKASENPNSKYISINHKDPKNDCNVLTGLKPTTGYLDMQIYYVIAYFDKKGTVRLASGEYPFKVKVVGKDGEGASQLKKLSLPKEITISERFDFLVTPTIEPADADAVFSWKSSDQGVVFTYSGTTAIEQGNGKYFSENVSMYVTEKDCCLRAREVGTAIVTVTTDCGLTASVTVNVVPSEIKSADASDIMWDIYDMIKKSLKR